MKHVACDHGTIHYCYCLSNLWIWFGTGAEAHQHWLTQYIHQSRELSPSDFDGEDAIYRNRSLWAVVFGEEKRIKSLS